MELGLQGRACVVTGASRGIGLAIARRLADEGARVVLVGRDRDALAAAADEVGGLAVQADVTQPGAPRTIVEACVAAHDRLDVLVHNAGTSFARPFDELTDDDWRAQYELHVVAPMRLTLEAAPHLPDGEGRVVHVASSAGKRPSLTNAAYSVTKAAQLSLSRVSAELLAPRGILVNSVTPGGTASELWMAPGGLADQIAAAKGLTREEAIAAQGAKAPLRRFAAPEEVADVVVFLCSARASFVTGAAWSVDGGSVATIV